VKLKKKREERKRIGKAKNTQVKKEKKKKSGKHQGRHCIKKGYDDDDTKE